MLQCIEQCPGLIRSFRRIQGCCSFICSPNKCVRCAFLAQHVRDAALGDRGGLWESTLSVPGNLRLTNRALRLRLGALSASSEQSSTEERPKGHSAVWPRNAPLSLSRAIARLPCSPDALQSPLRFHITILTHILHGGWKSFQKMPIIFSCPNLQTTRTCQELLPCVTGRRGGLGPIAAVAGRPIYAACSVMRPLVLFCLPALSIKL